MKQIKRFQLGKRGLSDEFVEQLKKVFEKDRVVKVDILKSACRDKKQAEEIGKEIVSALGENYDFKLIGYVLTLMKFRKKKV